MLQGVEYVPLLYTKRAEIRALENLDPTTRGLIFPILAVRPWPNTNTFDKIFPYLASATEGYRYGLDLDTDKRGKITSQSCAADFDALFDPADGFSNYYDFIASAHNRVPVLRDENGSFVNLNEQFDCIDALHNGIIIRIRRDYTHSYDDLLNLGRLVAADSLFVVDVGWSRDVLQQEDWASQQIEKISGWDATVEIVVMSSSFPNSFSHIKYDGSFFNDDRELYGRLVQRHNMAKLVYGDWASTRRSQEQGGGTHYDRIDTATFSEWTSYRQTDEEVGYKVIADRLIDDDRWSTYPQCWGKNRIECTSLDIPNKIRGTEAAISSRINMHITAQANQGAQLQPPDEPYVDIV